MSTLNSKRTSRVHFEDAVDIAEDADLVTKKNKSRYWSKGERRYSEAEKAFLSRVRIRSVVGRNRQRKFGCLTFFDPAGMGCFVLFCMYVIVANDSNKLEFLQQFSVVATLKKFVARQVACNNYTHPMVSIV